MEENKVKKKGGIQRAISSLFALYWIPIHGVLFTVVLYLMKIFTSLHIELESLFIAYIFVIMVITLNSFSFLIDITINILGEFLSFIPSIFFRFISESLEVLFLFWLISKLDHALHGIELSLYGQIVFAFSVNVITGCMIASTKSVSIDIDKKAKLK